MEDQKWKRIMPQRVYLTAIILVLISYTGCITPINGQPETFAPYYSEAIDFQFSGISQEGIKACPWVLNSTAHIVTGINEEFRAYFRSDVKNITEPFTDTLYFEEFIFTFLGAFNTFKRNIQPHIIEPFPYQYDPAEFDPYFGVLSVIRDFRNETSLCEWNNTIVPIFKEHFTSMWYVDQVKFSLLVEENGDSEVSFPSYILIFSAILPIVGWKRRRRKE